MTLYCRDCPFYQEIDNESGVCGHPAEDTGQFDVPEDIHPDDECHHGFEASDVAE